MQLMADALAVLGGRHGVVWNPTAQRCEIIRFDEFFQAKQCHLRAGIIIDGETYMLPLCADGGQFFFYDQRLTPCTMAMSGIDKGSYVKVKLTAVTPFRPRDADFSTTPVLGFRLEAEILESFRWLPRTGTPSEGVLFFEIDGGDVVAEASGADSVDLTFTSVRLAGLTFATDGSHRDDLEELPQRDRLVVTQGRRDGIRFVQPVTFGAAETVLEVAWCSHNAPVLEVQGALCPFAYTDRFADLDTVAAWARTHTGELFENAARVDGILATNSCSKSMNNLLAQTLHSWLINTWWVKRDGRDWFSVWEGSCHFHSTVDVEFTQSPFYLATWPELLGIELDFWPEFSKDGAATLGAAGEGTLFLSHDTGWHCSANGQVYPHEMEVEETTNYLILSYAYYKRTGDDSLIRKHADTIEKYLAFLAACDTTGNGIPDKGVANTIDDASPAVQFGQEQVYLGVKTLAAFMVGVEMLQLLGRDALAATYTLKAAKTRHTIEEHGWMGDHYATLLKKGGRIINAWTHERYDAEEIPGWDAAQIYTANALPPLDMVGFDLGLDAQKLATDLRVAAERCLREYGCIHSDYDNTRAAYNPGQTIPGLMSVSANPGWISMNMLRDMAAFYRGVDLRALADRYWDWQTTTNSQEAKIFFETFGGNNLCFYPRGVAVWGYFDALAGLVIDQPRGVDCTSPAFPQTRVPRLFDANWAAGTCTVIESGNDGKACGR